MIRAYVIEGFSGEAIDTTHLRANIKPLLARNVTSRSADLDAGALPSQCALMDQELAGATSEVEHPSRLLEWRFTRRSRKPDEPLQRALYDMRLGNLV